MYCKTFKEPNCDHRLLIESSLASIIESAETDKGKTVEVSSTFWQFS